METNQYQPYNATQKPESGAIANSDPAPVPESKPESAGAAPEPVYAASEAESRSEARAKAETKANANAEIGSESAALLYDPAEAAQIVHHLTDGYFDPEYILLFGKLAGGTPHSDPAAYDLLMVVRNSPEFDWFQAKRILRYKMPCRHRKITYINLYILPFNHVESTPIPFLYFAHSEGKLLYCNPHHCFRRPRRPIDFARAHAEARFHFDSFRTLGNDLLEQAQDAWVEGRNNRLAAQFTAQALVYFYHALYYVYHGMSFDLHDPVVMHDRMRTLSTRLMLVFDDNHIKNIFTLPRLKEVLMKTTYDAEFYMPPHELELHMDRVQQAARIIESCAACRLELYEELSGKR